MSKKAGQIRDLKEAFIGEYIYLRREDQAWLDAFCKSWLRTYENDSRFFLTIDLETTGLDFYTGNILLISVSSGQHAIVFRPQELNMELFREVLNTIPLNNHNIKFDLKWLYFHLRVDPVVCWDTMLAAQVGYAGNFPQKSFALDNVVGQLLNYSISKEVRQAFIGRAVDDEFTDEEVEYSARDAILTHLLVFNQKKRLKNTGLLKLFETVEIPLVTILARSEYEGVRVDLVRLQELFDEKESDLDEIYQDIQTLYQSLPNKPTLPKGVYNPGSPKQIVDVLASQGIRVLNTEEITLAETRKKYPNCDILGETIRYRELKSEISKYLKSWLKKYIHPVTGKIHPNFKPCGTTTGRLACAEPNMQNITGDYRTMIIPTEGWSIISQDYSQFEFRACAGLTQEPSLIKSFEDRSKLLPQIKPLAASYGYIDVDNFVKDIKKKKLQVRSKEEILVDSFAETDIHVRNAALILGKLPKDVDYLTERSVGKCVSLDTLVHLEGKAVTVESLLPKKRKRDTYYELKGVKVLTDTGYCTSPQIYYSGSAPAVRVTTQGGRTIVCAPHHRFRSVDKRDHYAWVQARDLTLGADIWVKPTPISYDSCISEEESLQAQLWAYYITQVRCEEGKLVGPTAAIEKCAELQKKLRFNGRPVKNGISSPALVKWLGETCGETELFPSSLLEASPAQRRVFLTTIVSLCGKHHLEFREGVNLRKMQNLLSLCGLNSWKVSNGLNLFREELEKFLSEDVVETNRGYRSRFPDSLIEKTFMSDTKEQTLALLSKKEKELCDFLAIHNLRKDRVLSIEAVSKVEMADLVVPENSTVVYEGLVTHNTIGYALLYGAGPGRIQDALVKDGFQVTLEECREFHDTFLRKMTRVADLIRRTHKRVVEPKDILDDEGEPIPRDEPIFFVETILGRKRFFSLPYVKYDREWMKEKAKAEREAVNFLFQGANADATKKAMVLMDEVFHEFPDDERPRILLSVHDEIVTHCPDQHIAKVSEMVERIMVETGSEAINWTVPIEVSRTVGKTWSK